MTAPALGSVPRVCMGLKDVVGLDGTSPADGSTLLNSNVECIGGALENSFAFLVWLLSCETLSPPMKEVVFVLSLVWEIPARSCSVLEVVP